MEDKDEELICKIDRIDIEEVKGRLLKEIALGEYIERRYVKEIIQDDSEERKANEEKNSINVENMSDDDLRKRLFVQIKLNKIREKYFKELIDYEFEQKEDSKNPEL